MRNRNGNYLAEPLVEPPKPYGRGAKATCMHCGLSIIYERPGDWYHSGTMRLECGNQRGNQSVVYEVDPDLERLLAEEEEIERRSHASEAHRIAAEAFERSEAKRIEQQLPQTVASLQKMATEFDQWASDEQYPVEDWQYEVRNGDTRLGYHDWLHKKRSE